MARPTMDSPASTPKPGFTREGEDKRRVVILRILCSLALGLQVSICILTLGLPLLANEQINFTFSNTIGLLTAIGYGLILRAIGKRSYHWCSRALVWLAVVFIGGSYLDSAGSEWPMIIGFIIPLSLAVTLLKPKEALIITFGCTFYSVGLHLVYGLLLDKDPSVSLIVGQLFVDALVMPFTAAILIIPTQSLNLAMKTLELQTAQLETTWQELEVRRQVSQQVSQQVLRLTTELNTNATQQASGSQEQAAAVCQVDSSMSELSATAFNIDRLTEQVSTAATQVASVTQEIEQTSTLSLTQSEQGLVAVNRTVEASRQVTELYSQLLSDLAELGSKNVNMRLVVDLLKSLTAQTHLLALNASIEAAGAGVYGERFKVVAQEVKSLADRSAEAQRQIADIIREVEETATTAQHSATQGYAKAEAMAQIAAQAGQVIASMRQVAEHSQFQAGSIKGAVGEVSELMLVVKEATAQQNEASESVLEALKGLNVVAAQTAESSQHIAATALDLEGLSSRLNLALAA